MFSIFGKRKPAETPTEEAIQGPTEPPKATSGDEFVFVERKSDTDPQPSTTTGGGMMYPPMPTAIYGASALPYPPTIGAAGSKQSPTADGGGSSGPIHYLQDVPFELSPQLASKDSLNGTQMQVDSILALLTRQISVDELAEEYTFALERSVQNDCY
ncbi:uncharacterized protein [Drosophila tropicalis]|uniref:uncharacterized protein n=1 Tax=Drosophila tropicalis TaxID=46794 RepID=UPI0035ABD19F